MQLPDHLKPRVRRLNQAPPSDGEFVLYWMRTAVRAHDNPALDVALSIANALSVPVLVYHALSERYRYASDRHHTFILQGAQDVAQQCRERGVGYAFHCERAGHRGRHLESLCTRAAACVTEEMPVAPLRHWTRRLADSVAVPFWAVDTATVVPMRLAGKGVTRAFKYRQAIQPHLNAFFDADPPHEVVPSVPPSIPELPFEPVNFDTVTIRELVAQCAIDHAVAPVADTPGGTSAGYARWQAFIDGGGLKRYAATRNDPNKHGVSRMSAFLHYGMVAPTRLARDARQHKGEGAEKWLDELVVWRELAYTWCLYAPAHETVDILPSWAVDTLRRHRDDPRPVYADEQLARATTGDRLWDLTQRSLLVHGELHNNLRMTWGKSLVEWSSSPEQALMRLVDLNHRYALDGRDPASYGGLLWCLGLFDRPFPETPVFGTLRTRSRAAHAKRLDVDAYEKHVRRPLVKDAPRVAIVGAGPAGAICGRTLADHGIAVTLFDKGRGAGGRASTRRRALEVDNSTDGGGDRLDVTFDHGAQSFTTRDRHIARWAKQWQAQGVVEPWKGPFATLKRRAKRVEIEDRISARARYVGAPGMNHLVKHLLSDMEPRFGQRVTSIEHAPGASKDSRWTLSGSQGDVLGRFDAVVVAAPAPQAADLLATIGPVAEGFREAMRGVAIAPCWAVMVEVVGEAPAPPWGGLRIDGDGPLSWIAREETKPQRGDARRWILHASAGWSATHIEEAPEAVAEALLDAARAIPGLEHQRFTAAVAHRWRFAQVTAPVGHDCLWDEAIGLGVCGDGLLGGRLESALVSGVAMAGRLLGSIVAHGDPVATAASPEREQLALFA